MYDMCMFTYTQKELSNNPEILTV